MSGTSHRAEHAQACRSRPESRYTVRDALERQCCSGTVVVEELGQAVLHDRVRAALVDSNAHARPIENRIPVLVGHLRKLRIDRQLLSEQCTACRVCRTSLGGSSKRDAQHGAANLRVRAELGGPVELGEADLELHRPLHRRNVVR
jgi:hypothetical protein